MSHVCLIRHTCDLRLMIWCFDGRYAATEEAMRRGVPLFDIPTQVKLPQYAHWQNHNECLHMNVWRILMEKSIGQ